MMTTSFKVIDHFSLKVEMQCQMLPRSNHVYNMTAPQYTFLSIYISLFDQQFLARDAFVERIVALLP